MKQFDWTKELETVDELNGFSHEARQAASQWAFCAIGEKYHLAERFVTTTDGRWGTPKYDEWQWVCFDFVKQLKNKQVIDLGMDFHKAVAIGSVAQAKRLYQQIQELPDET